MTVQNITAEKYDQAIGIPDIDAFCVAATVTNIEFRNDGNVLIFVSNGSAGAITATVKSVPDCPMVVEVAGAIGACIQEQTSGQLHTGPIVGITTRSRQYARAIVRTDDGCLARLGLDDTLQPLRSELCSIVESLGKWLEVVHPAPEFGE